MIRRGLNDIREEEIEPIFDLHAPVRTFAANYFHALQIEIIYRNTLCHIFTRVSNNRIFY